MNARIVRLDSIAESDERLKLLLGVGLRGMRGSVAVGDVCKEVSNGGCKEPDVGVENCRRLIGVVGKE